MSTKQTTSIQKKKTRARSTLRIKLISGRTDGTSTIVIAYDPYGQAVPLSLWPNQLKRRRREYGPPYEMHRN